MSRTLAAIYSYPTDMHKCLVMFSLTANITDLGTASNLDQTNINPWVKKKKIKIRIWSSYL